MAVCRIATDGVVLFWCPGCETYHGVWTDKPNPTTNARWTWNGSLDSPTFSPSILVHGGENYPRCHSYVRNGQIEFLSDCTHALAGKTVAIPNEE